MWTQGLPKSGRTRVYRKIVAQLKTDPTLESLGIEWIPWDGSTEAVVPTVADAPAIVLFPTLGPMEWASVDAQAGDLEINVRMFVPGGFDATACLDLWEAIEQAIYPFNDRERQRAFKANLRGDGRDALTGEIRFVSPASIVPQFNAPGSVSHFLCEGRMSVRVLRSINP